MRLKKVTEGQAVLRIPDPAEYGSKYNAPVFYNPVMEADRSLSAKILSEKFKGKEYKAADCLAGTGARGIRYALEAGAEAYCNDHNPLAVQLIKKNAELNDVHVKIFREDARVFLLENKPFDAVDVDPFGSPVSFLSAAASSLKGRGSVLFATATDTGALSAAFNTALLRRYGVRGVRTSFYPELGVRNLAYAVLRKGAEEDACLIPFHAYAREHYYRVFTVHAGWAKTASRVMKKDTGYYEYCPSCDYRASIPHANLEFQRECPVCGKNMEVIGPTFLGRITQELPFREPYIDLHYLAKKTGARVPKTDSIITALQELGYRAVKSPFTGKGIVTNAGFEEVRQLVLEKSS